MRRFRTIIAKLQGGPNDGDLLRMEGDQLPTALIFGDIDEPESDVYGYTVIDKDDPGCRTHYTFKFTGQCNSSLLPAFLWDSDWWVEP